MLIALALLPAAQAQDGFMVNSENVLFTSRGDAFFPHFQKHFIISSTSKESL
jgi:hypothetical protein